MEKLAGMLAPHSINSHHSKWGTQKHHLPQVLFRTEDAEDYLPLIPSNTKSNIPWNHEILVMGFHLNTIALRF
jgi:hypothetical protein